MTAAALNDGLREVRLLGGLGAKFGARHRLLIASPAEAVRALVATRPGFERELVNSGRDGIGYRVLVDDEVIDPENALHLPSGRGRITIAPVIVGAGKGGLFGIVGGVALIALSFNPALAAPLVAGFSASLSSVAFGIGMSMVLNGVSQLLAGTPKAQKPNERDGSRPSYLFNGPVNTTQQGHAVPVLYGRAIVGSAVISAGIKVTDLQG